MGVRLIPQKIIRDGRGEIRHFMKKNDFGYSYDYGPKDRGTVISHFGEVYFSVVLPGVVKAWHIHKEMCLNYICVVGKVFIALYDGREKSPTYGAINTFTLTDHEENHARLTIPPGVWNGFRAPVGWADPVLIANCADRIHDPDELIRKPPDALNFNWGPYKLGG